ncbi:TonB-dependent receptor [Maribellus comscasis]|nr:TonB-dependent receptor [Maribellus comscasis]
MTKLTTLLILISFMQISAEVYSQAGKLDLNVKNLSIQEILEEIEDNSEYRFFYDNAQVDLSKKISINTRQEELSSILKELFEGTDLSYEIKDYLILITSKDAKTLVLDQAEQKNITGLVSDESGQPLPGVTVVVKGTSTGTVTDNDGKYILTGIDDGITLIFSFVGMRTQEITVDGQSSIDITMVADAIGIEEVVAVGYGTLKKRDVTGSIVSIDNETIERTSSGGNVLSAIKGSVPGLNIITTQASAEQSSNIEIRGVKSITASNQPLIIVDGIPFSGSLSEFPTADIGSIEVLKDASSSAIYGSRGANGVIIITTKKGESGKTRVQIQSKVGFLELAKKPDIFTGPEFYDKKLEYNSRTFGLTDPEEIFTPSELELYNAGTYTDWIDVVTRVGKQQEHTISLSGSDEEQSFYVSGNFLQVKGIAKNDDFSRYSFRFNYNNTLTPWLKFATNTSLVFLDRDGLPADFRDAYYMNPLSLAYNEDGTIKRYPWPERLEFASPLDGLVADDINREYKVFSNNYLDVDIPFISGLNYRLNTGVTFRFRNNETYYNRETKTGFESGGISNVNSNYNTNYLVEHILSYRKDIEDHSIFLTGLYSFQKDEYRQRGISSSGFTSDILTTWQASGAALAIPSSNFVSSSLVSQMARLNYSFKQRYSLTATIRRDGYSGFGADTKYGVFPSVGAAWNIGEENFMAGADWVNYLKLRASWGKNGNQAIGAYSTLSRMAENNYLGGETATETAPGFVPSALANPNLGWETTRTIDGGIDFGLFDGKLQGALSLYKSKVTDLLLNRRISTTLGIPGSSIRQNIGETENKGYEFSLSSDIINSNDFLWNLDFNISSFKNKIVDLYGDGQDDVLNRWFIGEPIEVIFGYVHDGIWQLGEEDEIANSPLPDKFPGATKVLDASGDGVIDEDDRRIQGSVYPDFRTGLNSYIQYKDFSVNLMFYAVVGVKKVNAAGLLAHTWEYRRNNGAYWDYWTEDNPTNKYYVNHGENNSGYPVLFLQDASYLRLRDIKVSYNFKNLLSDVVKLQDCTLFFNVDNVFTVTKWQGMDPELIGASEAFDASQWDVVPVPPQRTYLFGLNLKF